MSDAIADTGPFLHLHEIDRFDSLCIFDVLLLPDLVAEELRAYDIDLGAKLNITVVAVERAKWEPVMNEVNQPQIQPADAQVFSLAQANQFQKLVLTDDLSLRQRLEKNGATVAGTIGILIRAYSAGYMQRNELDQAIDTLFTTSTLHLSSAFRTLVRKLLTELA